MSQSVYPHFEGWVLELDESIEDWRNKIRMNPGKDDRNRNSKHLQKHEKILSPNIHHLHIPINDRWENN